MRSKLAICIPLVTFPPVLIKAVSFHLIIHLLSYSTTFAVTLILVVRPLSMACLHVVLQIDGFQSGKGEFHFKAIGMAHPKTHTCQLRRLDKTELLSHSAAAISTYGYQARQHG